MNTSEELRKLEAAIQAQEGLLGQGILPDEQIQATLQALRAKRADYQAQLQGSGAVALGNNNQVVGQDGILVDGNIGGDLITGVKIEEKHYHAAEGADPDQLHTAYLSHVYESTSQLALAGIDRKTASDAEARLNLGAVYTALLTLTPEAQESLQKRQRAEIEHMEEHASRRTSALEQLNRHARLVLLGDPGSGKSTFVNFVALCLAGAALNQPPDLDTLISPLPQEDEPRRPRLPGTKDEKPQPQPWDHGLLLPVRVILRDFAARGLPPAGQKASAKNLWDFIAAELTACCLDDYAPHLRKHLLEQGGLLLLDGLDEVPEASQRRAQIKQAVEDFAAVYAKCRILVTSRTYAYQKQDWRLKGFQETVLAPFSRGQISQFVQRWYDHIAILRGLNADDARGRAALLQRAIFASDRLMGLAERPLLLTLMSSLHAWRGGTLPEKREELYADTVDLLLDWWENPKVVRNAQGKIVNQQPSLAEWLKVDRAKVRVLLNELAFAAHARQPDLSGTADVAEGDLVTGLMRLSQNPEVNPARLVEFLTARAGLLLPRGVGVYTFPHRTFQEYLAACHLTDNGYPDEAARLGRTDPNRWREVVLLAGAKAARGGTFALWPLVDALCGQEPSEHSQAADYWGALLAGQSILENANPAALSQPNQIKTERVQRWQVHILASDTLSALERVRAGNTLAALGDPRFDPQHAWLPKDDTLGFMHIPAGKFLMGSDPKKDKDAEKASECPQHEVDLPEFWIARYPVTVAQYDFFVKTSGYQTRDPDSLRGQGNHPVVDVTWYDALAYCQWLNEQMGQWAKNREKTNASAVFWQGILGKHWQITLPSEAEWEKAARGDGQARIYPWGDEFIPRKANTTEIGVGRLSAVGCFPGGASSYGLLEMSGNVWEWTRSAYAKYPYAPKDGRENTQADRSARRVLRGGSFHFDAGFARLSYRHRNVPDFRGDLIGFRVVVVPCC